MEVLYTNVNWIAVITGTALAFGLGGFWYGPRMFGPKWAEGSGIPTVEGHPVNALAVQALGTFLLAWVIGIAVAADAYWAAGLIVLMVATILAGGCLFSQKNTYAVLTESSFVVVNGIIMLACQLIF